MSNPCFQLQVLLNDERVQSAIPNLPSFLSPSSLEKTPLCEVDSIMTTLHRISEDLYSHLNSSQVWWQSCRDNHNDLLWFMDRANLEKPSLPASSVRTTPRKRTSLLREKYTSDQSLGTKSEGPSGRKDSRTRFGDLTDFEDLFYMIWHKIKTVYHELQVRYMNEFIKLTDIIHHRGPSLNGEESLRVGDFVTLLQVWWDEITEPSLMATLHHHLRSRVVQPDLLPGYQPERHTERDEDDFKSALQNRISLPCKRSSGLKDLNALSPITVIDQVYKRHGITLDCAKDAEAEIQESNDFHRIEFGSPRKQSRTRSSMAHERVPDATRLFPCTCSESCPCKDLCTIEPDGGCLCAMHTEFYSIYEVDQGGISGTHSGGHATEWQRRASLDSTLQSKSSHKVWHSEEMLKIASHPGLGLSDPARGVLRNVHKPLPPLPISDMTPSTSSSAGMTASELAGPDTPSRKHFVRSGVFKSQSFRTPKSSKSDRPKRVDTPRSCFSA